VSRGRGAGTHSALVGILEGHGEGGGGAVLPGLGAEVVVEVGARVKKHDGGGRRAWCPPAGPCGSLAGPDMIANRNAHAHTAAALDATAQARA
jgi:hypothetical protein